MEAETVHNDLSSRQLFTFSRISGSGIYGEAVGLGVWVGMRVGNSVGRCVGKDVGAVVGSSVGEYVGSLVGVADGEMVGELDGDGVGTLVGVADGEMVGELDVGESDGPVVGISTFPINSPPGYQQIGLPFPIPVGSSIKRTNAKSQFSLLQQFPASFGSS